MDTFSPSLKDTFRNRLREYLICGTVQFNHQIAREILVSMDKDNAQVGKSSKLISKAVDAAITTGGFLAGAGSAARGLSMPLLINSNKIFTLKLPHQGTICWLRYILDITWLSSYIS